jgi:hypothetical protein
MAKAKRLAKAKQKGETRMDPVIGSPSDFNPAQLATIDEARSIAAMIEFRGGIAPEVPTDDYHNDVSGIYLAPWADPTGSTPEPRIGDARPFLLRFNPTGLFQPSGFNVGLQRDLAIRHAAEGDPPNWAYALHSLATEVEGQISNANQG